MAQTGSANRWPARRGLARLVRLGAFLGPIIISVAFAWTVTHFVQFDGGPLWLLIAWWLTLSAASTGVLIGLDRLARRALPLAALLQLSLVFPDEAPSRFHTAMTSLTTKELQQELKDAREGRTGTPNEAAQRLLRFVATLTAHDRITRGHSERVRAYSQMIGTQLELPDEDIDRLNWAALIHDVGKLAVPTAVLNKGGKPTDEEWRTLRRHTVEGARLVAPLRPWLGEWCHAVEQHHEHWDGTGYPHGLKGEDISLGGRIVAVADVFDVMTSPRSYKPAGSVVDARRELTECAGSQFDPGIVRAFLNISLGRLRFAVGPLAWLANVPFLGQASVSSAVGGAAGSVAIASTAFLGVLGDGAVAQEAQPPAPDIAERAVAQGGTTGPGPSNVAPGAADSPKPSTEVEASKPRAATDAPGVAESPSDPPPAAPSEPATPESPSAPSTPAVWQAPDLSPSLTEDVAATFPIGLPNVSEVTSLRITREPDFGQISVPADDTLRYVPEQDFNGLVTSTYEACWGTSQCDAGEVTMSVAGVNDRPVAVDDEWGTGSAPRVIDVLENDRDVDGDDLSIALEGDAPLGSVALVGDEVSYTPPPAFAGPDSFEYRIDDGNGGTDTATVRLTVDPGNAAPTAGDDIVTLSEGSIATFNVLANDSDPDGSGLRLAGYDDSGIVSGSLQDNGDGSFTYTPGADFVGTESFTYKAVDDRGGGDSATVDITVTGVNDAPEFIPGADVAVTEDAGAQSIGGWASAISAGPADEAGQTVSFSVANDNPGLFATAPAIASDGTLSFTPAADANGSATITVSPSDDGGTANGGADTGAARTATITVTPVNDGPAAAADSFSPAEDQTGFTFDVLANDSDPEGDTLSVSSFNGAGITNGTLTDNGGGSFSYTPDDDWNGVESFTYDVSDGNGGTDTATATLTVTAVPDAPEAADDAYTTPQNTALVVAAPGVASNDADADGDSINVQTALIAGPSGGSVVLNADGSFTYTPNLGFSGTDGFTYRVDDGTGLTDDAVVSISVTAVPTNPLSLYMQPSGSSADDWGLSTTPAAAAAPVPDHDGSGDPGLRIKESDGDESNADPAEWQTWTYPMPAPTVLNGPVTLRLWSTSSEFWHNSRGHPYLYLYECDGAGANCTKIAENDVHVHSWNRWVYGSWVYRDLTIGSVSRTITAGRTLQMRMLFKHDDLWVALTAAYPSALVITTE